MRHKIRFLAVLLAAMMCLVSAFAEEDGIAEDLGGLTGQVDETGGETGADVYDAELLIGYVAASGASVSPFLCNDWDLISLNQLVFESLVTLDENQKPSPMLADNWTHEGDVWTFTLRSGITFHNGQPLTAYDVKSTYDCFMSAGDANPYYARLKQFISALEAVDDRTVAVKAKYSGMITLYAMTFPIVQSATVYDDMPRGTGPFWYVSYYMDNTVRIELNPLWWQQTPTVASITFCHFASSADAIEGLQTGQVDMLATRSTSAALCRKLANLTSMDYGTFTYEMLVPNLDNASVMSDVDVRRAVMYAIDRSVLATNAYLDMATQSEVPILPGTWLYESQSAQYYYSPERALQMLYDAGWSDMTGDMTLNKLEGIQLKELTVNIITYNESGASIRENAAGMIASYLEAVGMKTQVEVLSKKEVQSRIKSGDYDLALVAVNLDEIPVLSSLLSSGGSLNLNGYSDATMDGLIQLTATAENEASLKQAFSQIQLQIVEDLPILGLYFRAGTVLSTRSLGGLKGIRAMNTFRGLEYLTQ